MNFSYTKSTLALLVLFAGSSYAKVKLDSHCFGKRSSHVLEVGESVNIYKYEAAKASVNATLVQQNDNNAVFKVEFISEAAGNANNSQLDVNVPFGQPTHVLEHSFVSIVFTADAA